MSLIEKTLQISAAAPVLRQRVMQDPTPSVTENAMLRIMPTKATQLMLAYSDLSLR
jgi:hypothetical protein